MINNCRICKAEIDDNIDICEKCYYARERQKYAKEYGNLKQLSSWDT